MTETNWIRDWQNWLDSLSTSGGNIVTLFVCSAIAGGLWMWSQHAHASNEAQMAIFGIFSGFTGALLQAQKGNSSRQQMLDRTASVLPIVSSPTPETPAPIAAAPTIIASVSRPIPGQPFARGNA